MVLSGTSLVDMSFLCFFYFALFALLCCVGNRVLLVGQAYCPRVGLVLFPIGFGVYVEEGAVFIVRCVFTQKERCLVSAVARLGRDEL